MDKAAAIIKIRKQLTAGNIEAALQLLIDNIKPERNNLRDLNNRAIQTKVQLEKTQRDELEGVISFENSKLSYNQITRQVVNLVDEWENPPEPSTAESLVSRGKFTPKMVLVTAILFVFAGIIIWQVRSSKGNDLGVISAIDDCPKFDSEAFNIMVLPYNSFRDPEAKSSPHRALATRLDRFKNDFSGNFKTNVARKDGPAPNDDNQAIQIAQHCMAELAIWGEYEHFIPANLGTIVTTHYKYIAPSETFEFTMLNVGEDFLVSGENNASNIPTRGFFIDTIQTYSQIINEGDLTDELENQFRLLFGVAVLQSGDPLGAAAILETTEPKDSSSRLLKEMTLAESYIKNGDKAAAVKAYDRALETHPNYWFATNNRALLYYEKGDYVETIETLNRSLREAPDNLNALTVRGAVRIKTRQLKEAEEDLQEAKRLNEQQEEGSDTGKGQYIQNKLELLEREKTSERNRIVKAENILDKDNFNISALTDLAEANRNLGNYQTAGKYADRILDLDKDNLTAISVSLETAVMSKDKKKADVIRKDVRQLDTATQNTILQQRPILKRILEQKDR